MRRVVDGGGFEAGDAARGALGVGWDAGSASSAAGVHLLGDEQLDRDAVARDPGAGLVCGEVVDEAGRSHRVLEVRVVVEPFGEDGEVGVDGVGGDRDVAGRSPSRSTA
jgi:hypothetical protein